MVCTRLQNSAPLGCIARSFAGAGCKIIIIIVVVVVLIAKLIVMLIVMLNITIIMTIVITKKEEEYNE